MQTTTAVISRTEDELRSFSERNSDKDIQLYKRILDWDLSRENASLVFRVGCTQEEADKMEKEYRKFLFLKIKYAGERLPMSKKVDDMWHMHVLSTRNYQDFCSKIAGTFLHHVPTISENENYALMPDYLNNTILLHAKHFGNPSPEFWPVDAQNGSCCGC